MIPSFPGFQSIRPEHPAGRKPGRNALLHRLLLIEMIPGDERDQDGGFVGVGAVGRVGAIAGDVALFHPSRAVHHDKEDAEIAQHRRDPLERAGVNGEPRDKHPGPEEDLAKVVGAAHHPEQPLGGRHVGVFGLLGAFLPVGQRLDHRARGHDRDAQPEAAVVGGPVRHAEMQPGGLREVDDPHRQPHDQLDKDRRLLAHLGVEDLFIGLVVPLPPQQKAAQPQAVGGADHKGDEQRGHVGRYSRGGRAARADRHPDRLP